MRFRYSLFRRSASCVLALLLLGTQLAARAGRPETGPGPLQLSNGEWTGPMLAAGSGSAGDVSWDAVWSGVMNIASADEALTGDFNLTADVSVTGPELSGASAATGTGSIGGPATAPLIQVEEMVIEVDMSVRGVSVAQERSLGAVEFGPMEVSLISATCNQVEGDWTTPISENLASAGVGGSVSGYWSLVRVDEVRAEVADPYVDEMRQLIEEAFEWRTLVYTTGSIQFPFLERLLDHAEELNRSLSRSTECDFVDAEDFMTAITAIVAEALNFALENPAGLSAGDLLRMTSAALRLGIIGEGATDAALAARLEDGIAALAAARLEETRDSPDCALVGSNASLTLGIAELLGDADLADLASGVFVGTLSC